MIEVVMKVWIYYIVVPSVYYSVYNAEVSNIATLQVLS